MYRKSIKLFTLTLFGLCFFISGYAQVQTTVTQTVSKKTVRHTAAKTATSTTLNLPAFSALDITGPVKVIVTCQQQKQSVTIGVAPSEIAEQVDTSVQNHTLIIDAHPQQFKPTPIFITINMNRPLTNLLARGSANVRGEYCGNPNLVITAKDSASVYLQGINAVHAIQNDSINPMVINGIQGKHLLLRSSRNGKIILSGKTEELDAQLEGSVMLDARSLQARSAHILTYDNTAAYVCVTEVLYGFAYDNSNIYYYETPQRVVKDTHASGNVLKAGSADGPSAMRAARAPR